MPSVVTAVWSCIRPGSHRPRPQGAALTVGDGGGLDRVLLALAGHKRPPAGPVGPGPADLGLGAVDAQLDPVGGGQQPRSPTTSFELSRSRASGSERGAWSRGVWRSCGARRRSLSGLTAHLGSII